MLTRAQHVYRNMFIDYAITFLCLPAWCVNQTLYVQPINIHFNTASGSTGNYHLYN